MATPESQAPAFSFSKKPAVVRSNLAGQIYDFLEEQIVSGEIRPGTKLSEVTIANAFGVSRQPVREAIARLERIGLAIRGRRDRLVARPTERLIRDTYEIWWLLDAGRTHLSSLAATPAEVDGIRELLTEMEVATAKGDTARLTRCSAKFHKLIASRCDNEQLIKAIESHALYMKWFRGLYLNSLQPSAARLKEHQKIVDCYARKNLAGLIEVIRQHVLRQRDEVLNAWRKEAAALQEGAGAASGLDLRLTLTDS